MRRDGFTLVEVLAAVFLTAIVMSFAVAFFVDLSASTERATERTRDGRRALSLLDRVARDVQGAYLVVKPPTLDPLAHPWLFLAESEYAETGSDRIKFTTRSHRPRSPLEHGADIAMVSYRLRPGEGGFELLRAVEPGLPPELDAEFLSEDDERWMIVADRVADFSVRFLSETGEWVESWDSSQLVEASALPLAAEIEVAYAPSPEGGFFSDPDALDFDDFATGSEEPGDPYVRRVMIPMRPIDIHGMLEAAAQGFAEGEEGDDEGEEEEDEEGQDGPTVAECLDPDEEDLVVEQLGEAILALPVSDPNAQATLASFGIDCS